MKAFSSAEPISARAIAISSIQGTFKEHVLFKLKQEMVTTDPRILADNAHVQLVNIFKGC